MENLKKLLEELSSRSPDAKIVFLGSSAERSRRLEETLLSATGKGWLNLVARTGLRELFYLLKSLSVCAGPDSGPAHVAASYGVPTLFLFSGTNVFEEWKSASESAHFLRHEVPCSPCHATRCRVEGHPCMSGIDPKAVAVWIREHDHVHE